MFKRIFLFLALTTSTLGLTGCFDAEVDEQSVPWSRPAEWERGAPGFGG
ncbi:MAG: hypothetical protein ACSHYA_07150 [Opitutaceae bacterium]